MVKYHIALSIPLSADALPAARRPAAVAASLMCGVCGVCGLCARHRATPGHPRSHLEAPACIGRCHRAAMRRPAFTRVHPP